MKSCLIFILITKKQMAIKRIKRVNNVNEVKEVSKVKEERLMNRAKGEVDR